MFHILPPQEQPLFLFVGWCCAQLSRRIVVQISNNEMALYWLLPLRSFPHKIDLQIDLSRKSIFKLKIKKIKCAKKKYRMIFLIRNFSEM